MLCTQNLFFCGDFFISKFSLLTESELSYILPMEVPADPISDVASGP
jgi:hypothetical protein